MSMSFMSSKDLVSALSVLALLNVVVNARPVTRTVRGSNSLRARAPCNTCDDATIYAWESTYTSTLETSTYTPVPSAASSVKTCSPNFEGAAVWVRASGDNATWYIPARPGKQPESDAKLEYLNGSTTNFRIEYTGFGDDSYLIKLGGIGNNSLVLGPSDNGIGLCPIQVTSNPSFKILCHSCAERGHGGDCDIVASSCTIMDTASGMYISGSNGTISLQAEASPSSSSSYVQMFDFIPLPTTSSIRVQDRDEGEHQEDSPCGRRGCRHEHAEEETHPCPGDHSDCPYADDEQ